MNSFFVKIRLAPRNKFHVEFWYGTDLRYDRDDLPEIPVLEISQWLEYNLAYIRTK